jgi:hypothetical protein
VDGNGSIELCGYQLHVYFFKFYILDGNGGKVYLEKANIAQISSPFLAPPSLSLPGLTDADRAAPEKSAYVAVDITLKNPEGEVVTAYIENNAEAVTPIWIQWKQP